MALRGFKVEGLWLRVSMFRRQWRRVPPGTPLPSS